MGGAQHAVGIARADHSGAHGPVGGEHAAIADRVAGAQVADLQDGRIEMGYGADTRVGDLQRAAAVQADARADHIEVVVGAEEDAA